jgi:hypothetical protein
MFPYVISSVAGGGIGHKVGDDSLARMFIEIETSFLFNYH